MSFGIFRKLTAAAFLLFFPGVGGHGQTITFGMDDKPGKTVAPTAAVWSVLRRYAAEFDCGRPQKGWFQIAKINLGDDRKDDLIAYPTENCIQGNNITNFFVFRNLGRSRYALVLKTGAFSVSILKRKTNGFNQIEANSMAGQKTLVRRYSFRGKSYLLTSEREAE